jgi:hypothetical protein
MRLITTLARCAWRAVMRIYLQMCIDNTQVAVLDLEAEMLAAPHRLAHKRSQLVALQCSLDALRRPS